MVTNLATGMAQIEKDFIMTGLPEWMVPPKQHHGPPYTDHQLEAIFAWLAEGNSYASLKRKDPTMPKHGELMRFLHKNPPLLEEYYSAQAAGMEPLTDAGLERAQGLDRDGTPSMDDINRIREEVSYIKWVAGKRASNRYGEKKQIDITTRLDLSGAMSDAEKRIERLINGSINGDNDPRVIEHMPDED